MAPDSAPPIPVPWLGGGVVIAALALTVFAVLWWMDGRRP